MQYIEPIQKLIAEFTKLPGVGVKTATRYAYSIINMDEADALSFSQTIQKIYDETKTYRDGKWMMFEPIDTSLFDDFIRLLSIKRKPNRRCAKPGIPFGIHQDQ